MSETPRIDYDIIHHVWWVDGEEIDTCSLAIIVLELQAELTRLKEENEQNKKRYADGQQGFARITKENEKLKTIVEERTRAWSLADAQAGRYAEENETLRQRNLSDPLLDATFKHLTKRIEELEGALVWPPKDVLVERCAAAVHLAYCKNYEQRKGEPYWTGGDYNKLDDETKEIDRTTVRAVLRDALRKDEHG